MRGRIMPLRVACRELSLFVRCKSNKHVKSGSAFTVDSSKALRKGQKGKLTCFGKKYKERLVF